MVDIAWLTLLHRAALRLRLYRPRPKAKRRQQLLRTQLAEQSVAKDFEDPFVGFYRSERTYLVRMAMALPALTHTDGEHCLQRRGGGDGPARSKRIVRAVRIKDRLCLIQELLINLLVRHRVSGTAERIGDGTGYCRAVAQADINPGSVAPDRIVGIRAHQ